MQERHCETGRQTEQCSNTTLGSIQLLINHYGYYQRFSMSGGVVPRRLHTGPERSRGDDRSRPRSPCTAYPTPRPSTVKHDREASEDKHE